MMFAAQNQHKIKTPPAKLLGCRSESITSSPPTVPMHKEVSRGSGANELERSVEDSNFDNAKGSSTNVRGPSRWERRRKKRKKKWEWEWEWELEWRGRRKGGQPVSQSELTVIFSLPIAAPNSFPVVSLTAATVRPSNQTQRLTECSFTILV